MNFKNFCLWCFIVTLSFYLLVVGKALLIPLVLAVFIWYSINVLATLFRRLSFRGRRLNKTLCLVLPILIILGLSSMLVDLLSANIARFIQAAPTYEENLNRLVMRIFNLLDIEQPSNLLQSIGAIDFTGIISQMALALSNIIGNAGIILIYVVFIFIEQKSFDKKLAAVISDPERKTRILKIIHRISMDTQTYIGIKTFTSILTGVLSYFVMAAIGLDFAVLWAVLIFLLNYIPTIGSILATIFPSLLALLQFNELYPFFVVAGGVGLLQILIGNFLEPRLMGKSLNLSPLVIILSLALWGALWGVTGMFLCVPITVIAMIILSYFPQTRPIAVILSVDGKLREDYNE